MNIIFNLCGPVNVFVKSCELDVYYAKAVIYYDG